MKLQDMKITKAERKERDKNNTVCGSPMGGDDYGYGLRITLNDAELKKLGIDKLPRVGGTIKLEADAFVIGVRSSSNVNSKADRSVELQLRKIGLDNDADESAESAVKSALDDM